MAASHVIDGASGSVEVVLDGPELVMSWLGNRFVDSDDEPEMARLNLHDNVLRIFPKKKSSTGFVDQYDGVRELRVHLARALEWEDEQLVGGSALEDLALDWIVSEGDSGELELLGLPDGFGKIFAYGLGLRRPYRGIVIAVEKLTSCNVVTFGPTVEDGVDGAVFGISSEAFAKYRRAIDLNRNRASVVAGRVNAAESHNAIAALIGRDLVLPALGRLPLIQAMTREVAAGTVFDAEDRQILARETAKQSRLIATEAPVEFGRLRHDLDLVSLEVLISQFDASLAGGRAKDEAAWQSFFETNTFALQQLFAAPLVLYRGQLTVKGSNAFGRGERIADFMLVNSVTKTAHVVEIKTPGSSLTQHTPYRGADGAEVYLPHANLLGAVTQVQAQMESTRLHLPSLLRDTPTATDIDITSVRGAVIVGRVDSLDAEQRASFLRYRDGLTHVEVLAFDEVRDRIRGLYDILSRSGSET